MGDKRCVDVGVNVGVRAVKPATALHRPITIGVAMDETEANVAIWENGDKQCVSEPGMNE